MNIAIVDSGIDVKKGPFHARVFPGIHVRRHSGGISYDDNLQDEEGHGTAVASLIAGIAPKASLYIVKVSSSTRKLDEEVLIKALEYAHLHFQIDIYNISIGVISSEPAPGLYEICRKITVKKSVIVASGYYNPNMPCFPAYFPFVLGVASGKVPPKSQNAYLFLGMKRKINVVAHGMKQHIRWLNGETKYFAGSSYAAARFSGILAIILGNVRRPSSSYLCHVIKSNSSTNVKLFNHFDDGRLKSRNKANSSQSIPKLKVFYPSKDMTFQKLRSVSDIKYVLTESNAADGEKCGLSMGDLVSHNPKNVQLIIGDIYNYVYDDDLEQAVNILSILFEKGYTFLCLTQDVFLFLKSRFKSNGQLRHYLHLAGRTANRSRLQETQYTFAEIPSVMICGQSFICNLRLLGNLKKTLSKLYKVESISTSNYGCIAGHHLYFDYTRDCEISNDNSKFRDLLNYSAIEGRPDLIITHDLGIIETIAGNKKNISSKSVLYTLNFIFTVRPDILIFNLPDDNPVEVDYYFTILRFINDPGIKVIFSFEASQEPEFTKLNAKLSAKNREIRGFNVSDNFNLLLNELVTTFSNCSI